MDSIATPVSVRRTLDNDATQVEEGDSLVHLMREVNLKSTEVEESIVNSRHSREKQELEIRGATKNFKSEVSGEKRFVRPASAGPVERRKKNESSHDSSRLSAFADTSEFREREPEVFNSTKSGSSMAQHWSHSSSSVTKDSSQATSSNIDFRKSKSRSSSQHKRSSQNTSRISKNSSVLDTTGSSRALDSSIDSGKEETFPRTVESLEHQVQDGLARHE